MNIAKILKNASTSVKLWSPLCGYCTISDVTDNEIYVWPTNLSPDDHTDDSLFVFNADGTCNSHECILWLVDDNGHTHQNWDLIK